MKSNETALSYFLIREIIRCFLDSMNYMEESEIIKYALIELKKSDLEFMSKKENEDKSNLNFKVIYSLFDLLENLGLISRKLENNQRFLKWVGFAQCRKKYGIVFKVDANKISKEKIINMKVSDGAQRKYATNNEQFIAAFFYQIYTKQRDSADKYISSLDYEQLKNEILLRDVGVKETEESLGKLRSLMQIMVYIGLVQKKGVLEMLKNEEEKINSSEYSKFISQSKSQNKGYCWIFKHVDVLMDEEYKLDEKEYFEQRNKDFKIEFKKLPPKTTPNMMDDQISGYALLQGKKWHYIMKSLVIIIGRAPTPVLKNTNTPHTTAGRGFKGSITWHVDLEINPSIPTSAATSRQQAFIAFNFYTENFEIKNLSETQLLYINGKSYSHSDDPVPLETNDMIQVNSEDFVFLLPKTK
ncbi:unnamed protein product [Moneuplotes crassus]|uniref:FHA domain-containing protein n=1 Tax=Euplotes crassus TaxID=5936 RepID=A0AAD1UST1_EUPCR|nr:unnamed protein product [Moneuplotes crassus]